ncbi:TRANSPARENT TESTA protein 12 [Spatholobus suberectus]|nr:TRANSPARENT TESTA protein 12 [Spatholobus suberectus]
MHNEGLMEVVGGRKGWKRWRKTSREGWWRQIVSQSCGRTYSFGIWDARTMAESELTHGVCGVRPLLLGLDSHSQIRKLSSGTVKNSWNVGLLSCDGGFKACFVGVKAPLAPLWGLHYCVHFQLFAHLCHLMFTGHLGALELAGASIASVGIQGLAYGIMRFLQAQNIVNPLAYMAVGVFLLHVLLNWLVVYVFDLGLLGASLTLSFSWCLLVLLNGLYILLSPRCKETWTGFSVDAFRGIWPYFKLTVASAVMLCLEIWYNQGLVILSGLLPNPTVALDSISIWYVNNLSYKFFLLLPACLIIISTLIIVRVSNELGAAHPRVTKFSVFIVNGTSILISLVFCVIILIFRVPMSQLFTSDAEVIEAVSNLTPLLTISVFLNGIQPILSGNNARMKHISTSTTFGYPSFFIFPWKIPGVAIGSGWQATVAYVNLACYYIIGLPIGCVLGFKTSLGVAGIWWGMVVGVLLQIVTLIILTARTKWDVEVEKATGRVKRAAENETLDQLAINA